MDARQLIAARGLLRWTQGDLVEKSGVSSATVRRLEAMDGELAGNATTLKAIERTFEDAGIVFLDAGAQTSGGVGVRLRKESSSNG